MSDELQSALVVLVLSIGQYLNALRIRREGARTRLRLMQRMNSRKDGRDAD